MHPESFVIDEEIEIRLKKDAQTYENFLGFSEIYRTIRIDTIKSCKPDLELFDKRLDKFIENTKANKMYT